ncbi:peptidoglycan recognition protein 1 [Patella vulgata]|uniref:peptidoglycan recognition protein 1 n=1 Tax=Patella vulgata TaxID=6465 RepID=UPI0021807F67|nr:peptidoglycan recognition protein 1 [Patella vulgata]
MLATVRFMQVAWAATNWLNIHPCGGGSSSSTQQLAGCPRIISRSEWGARPANYVIGHLPGVPTYVFIHHGATAGCTSENSCKQKVREYQNYHMDGHKWPDIGYTFVIGEDGNVYEARGWDIIGAHTYNYNYNGLGFCIIGDFTSRLPNTAALNAVKQLINCGVKNGKISTSYILRGHRDVNPTACPGEKLEALIKTWPHY